MTAELLYLFTTGPHFWDSILRKSNIMSFHHFPFSEDEPGIVYCKESVSSPEQQFVLLKNRAVIPPAAVLPQEINPEGLSQERKNYLYREIRQFCRPGTENLVAQAP